MTCKCQFWGIKKESRDTTLCKEHGKVKDIADHYAYTCECGSVHFNLLKSGKVECTSCGVLQLVKWGHPIGG